MKVSVREIAKLAGVSTATVSRAFTGNARVSPEHKQSIFAAAKALGYRKAGKKTIVILIDDILDGYLSLLLQQLMKNIQERGMRVQLIPHKSLSLLDDEICTGVITTVWSEQVSKFWTNKYTIPLVCINASGNVSDKIYQVNSDDRQGIHLALKKLQSFGHRKIGLLTHHFDEENLNRKLRIQAFNEFFANNGNMCGFVRNVTFLEMLPEQISSILQNACTAMIVAGEGKDIAVARALRLFNKTIPDDISVISFEHPSISKYLSPPFTTLEQKLEHLSESAINILEKQLDGEKDLGNILIPYNLFSRGSVGSVPL